MQDNEKIIRNFLAGWNGHMIETFNEHIASDCLWRNSGLPDCKGKEACMHLTETFHQVYPHVENEIRAIATSNDYVLVERIGKWMTKTGEIGAINEVAGVYQMRDGKIIYNHDYYDPNQFRELYEKFA